MDKDARIGLLEQELFRYTSAGIPFLAVTREAKINYKNIEEIGCANNIVTNFSEIDTVPTFNIRWNDRISTATKQAEMERLQQWLEVRLDLDTLAVRSVE